MPWSNQSGGPWGSGPQSRGPKPPDLEEFLRRSQDLLRGLTPGNLGGRGFVLIAVAALVGAFPDSSGSSPTSSVWCCASANSCAKCRRG